MGRLLRCRSNVTEGDSTFPSHQIVVLPPQSHFEPARLRPLAKQPCGVFFGWRKTSPDRFIRLCMKPTAVWLDKDVPFGLFEVPVPQSSRSSDYAFCLPCLHSVCVLLSK